MNEPGRRFPLGKILAAGSSGSGVGAWWRERVTAIALVPLTLWFIFSIVVHTGDDYGAVMVWLRRPATAALLVLMLVVTFYHMALGLQVVIEDYVHSSMKRAVLTGMRLACMALALVGILAVLNMAFRA